MIWLLIGYPVLVSLFVAFMYGAHKDQPNPEDEDFLDQWDKRKDAA